LNKVGEYIFANVRVGRVPVNQNQSPKPECHEDVQVELEVLCEFGELAFNFFKKFFAFMLMAFKKVSGVIRFTVA